MKRPVGRPKLPRSQARQHRVTVLLTLAERAQLKKLASGAGRKPNDYLRWLMGEQCR